MSAHYKIPKVNILGIPLYASDLNSAAALVIQTSQTNDRLNYCISATGAHGLVHAKKNPDFRQILKNFFINLPDGMPGVWIGRLKGATRMKRCYGPSFFERVIVESKDSSIKHFFCGGNNGVADELREAVKAKFGNDNVVGTFCPPFMNVND